MIVGTFDPNTKITKEKKCLLTSDDQDGVVIIYPKSTADSIEYDDARTMDIVTKQLEDRITNLTNSLSKLGTYSKPTDGIPKSDLSSDVQQSLDKADSALQSFTESDPTVPTHVKNITSDNISKWDGYESEIESIKQSVNNSNSYSKPTSGIPKADLSSSVQQSLSKADSALQSFTESDPTVPAHVKNIKQTDIDNWNSNKTEIESIKQSVNNSGTYSKPANGIPKTDLSSSVQQSLNKADSALQNFTETDPTVPAHVKNIKQTDIDKWNNKVDKVDGKGLSTCDFTQSYKNTLDSLGTQCTYKLEGNTLTITTK